MRSLSQLARQTGRLLSAQARRLHANLERLARVDFGVEFEWQPVPATNPVPKHVLDWINTSKVGTLQSLKGNPHHGGPGTMHAALARIKYGNCPGQSDSWLLLIKPSLAGDEPLDITQYAASHEDFPQDSTGEQFFDDEQWESYRMLGYTAAIHLLK